MTMPNKPNTNNRDDIKVIITATALTLTLAFWNLFSNGAQKPVQTVNLQPSASPPQPPIPTVPVKILLGGLPPKTTIIVSQPSAKAAPQRNQQHAPQPVTNTSSSK
jgi:hypothetical protein